MRIMVCGPIGGLGIDKIRQMAEFLEKNNFKVIRQYGKNQMDYSHIRDFRTKKGLSHKIIEHDLATVKKADVLVVLPTPSFGVAIEMFVGKSLKKKVILFSEKPMPSPWPIKFSDYVVANKKSLLNTLQKILQTNCSPK